MQSDREHEHEELDDKSTVTSSKTCDEVIEHYGEKDYSRLYPVPVQRVIPSHPSPTERYYDVRFFVPLLSDHAKEHRNAADQVVMFHSNRICIICLSPHHPVLDMSDGGKEVRAVHFEDQGGHNNRLDNKVSGKKKHGGQKLKERSVICRIECVDGSEWHVLTGVKGKLVEVNEQLIREPNLLRTDSWSKGYIAIVMANVSRVQLLKDSLLSPEAYQQVLDRRKGADETEDRKHEPAEEPVCKKAKSSIP